VDSVKLANQEPSQRVGRKTSERITHWWFRVIGLWFHKWL